MADVPVPGPLIDRDALSEQIHLLGATIVEQEGPALFARVEAVPALATAHRGGDLAAGPRDTG